MESGQDDHEFQEVGPHEAGQHDHLSLMGVEVDQNDAIADCKHEST